MALCKIWFFLCCSLIPPAFKFFGRVLYPRVSNARRDEQKALATRGSSALEGERRGNELYSRYDTHYVGEGNEFAGICERGRNGSVLERVVRESKKRGEAEEKGGHAATAWSWVLFLRVKRRASTDVLRRRERWVARQEELTVSAFRTTRRRGTLPRWTRSCSASLPSSVRHSKLLVSEEEEL